MPRGVPSKRGHLVRFLYFVEAPIVGLIKIGITADLKKRFLSLRSQSACELNLLLILRGTSRDEWAIHGEFASERSHGEWFKTSGRMGAFVAELKSLPHDDAERRVGKLQLRKIAGLRHDNRHFARPRYTEEQKKSASAAARLRYDGKSAQRERASRLFSAIDTLLQKAG